MAQPSKSSALKGSAIKAGTNSISRLLGSRPVLPGESDEKYCSGLEAALVELGASTPLQSYLVESIYDCLWWIRRYEEQKRITLVHDMTDQLVRAFKTHSFTPDQSKIFDSLNTNQSSTYLKQCIAGAQSSIEKLQQKAIRNCWMHIEKMDELIALKTKTLAGFQVSYEQLTNRKIQRERLEMQNALLRRDLAAIDMQVKLDQSTPGPGQ
jgi:hypothetical protein